MVEHVPVFDVLYGPPPVGERYPSLVAVVVRGEYVADSGVQLDADMARDARLRSRESVVHVETLLEVPDCAGYGDII